MAAKRAERTTSRGGKPKAQDDYSRRDEPDTSGLCAVVGRSRLGTNTAVVTRWGNFRLAKAEHQDHRTGGTAIFSGSVHA
jgi:hypothetical protein